MLSRRHLRIKVLQALYAFMLSENDDLRTGEKLLLNSLDKLYELYINQLSLLIETANFARQRFEERKQKFYPTEEDLNPNTRYAENLFLRKLENNKTFNHYINKYKVSWFLDQEMVKHIYGKIIETTEYDEFMASGNDSWEAHAEIIASVVRHVLYESEVLIDFYEDRSIFWSGDYFLSLMMILKTVNYFSENCAEDSPMPSLIKTENEDENEDLNYLVDLFRRTIVHDSEYESLIAAKANNWESDRIAVMDMLLLKMAICELLEFPSIPVKVTLDEYIEISKSFSTPRSGQFINGILDRLVAEFRESKRLVKKGRGLRE